MPQLVYADDGLFLSNDIATMQLALECAWLVTKICGNSLQVKQKKKSAWSATYWENDEERDVEGYEMRMPDGMTIPQLRGDESYKYLGTELRTGWANGEGQTEMRKRCVADCKRVIWIIGNLPHLTGEQIRRNMALALSGIIGYYGRSTAITWKDCHEPHTVLVRVVGNDESYFDGDSVTSGELATRFLMVLGTPMRRPKGFSPN